MAEKTRIAEQLSTGNCHCPSCGKLHLQVEVGAAYDCVLCAKPFKVAPHFEAPPVRCQALYQYEDQYGNLRWSDDHSRVERGTHGGR